ncbi:protein LLP homolog [Daphnia magna]|uniref:Protein LLP n=2 Tax=Daphnia magna TaxID=35525 RepID=A0A0P6E1C2_9CRUS|nr:protein LLP homolog [Daphnia magna]KAK4023871.1 hypothetical protein OUZ56_009265 [Daphnia magna]KZS20207.1 Uncharacterized protein APZ42_013217 [Daphnia magna]
MAKSLRSKWKRKMRAIKREKMDVKVLARMNKMLVESAAEAKLDAQEEKFKQKMKKDKAGEAEEMAEVPASDPPTNESPAEAQEGSMEVEGDDSSVVSENGVQRKLCKPNLKTMRNEKNQFPSWMSTKKIKYHKRLTKRSVKRNTKEAKKNKIWKRACASL